MAAGRILSHFGVYTLRSSYWQLDEEERALAGRGLRDALAGAADGVHFYRTVGGREGGDGLVWSSVAADGTEAPARFFERHSEALRPFRRYVRLRRVLWGLTDESPYSRGATDRGIDPFAPRQRRYLIVYPFAKTAEWYRTPVDERRAMMSEHIKAGREHNDVDQLLLYSTGLQDHEFVVVYEADDLADFSRLVRKLRETRARCYTQLDTPVHVGVYATPDPTRSRWP